MPIDFNGSTLTITLSSGVTEVDVREDLYESWKDWLLGNNSNLGFPRAFRPVGGDPLSSVINAGSYFFLNNVAGWRIKPPEEDITIVLTGNLALEDVSVPSVLPTDGAFTAAIFGLQPVTQGVTPQMGAQLEFASFEGMVHYSSTSSNQLNGADPLSLPLPLGNMQYPLNNIPDCIIVRTARGLTKSIHCMTNVTLGVGDNVDNFTLVGTNPTQTIITIGTSASTINTMVENASVNGTLDGGTEIRNCDITTLDFINGRVLGCSLDAGPHSLGGGSSAEAHFINCDDDVAGEGAAVIDCGGDGPALILSRYSGDVKLTNKIGSVAFTIGLAGGHCIIDATCTTGIIVVNGNGKVIDSTGAHMLSGTYNGGLTLINECTFGGHLHDLWQRKGLDPVNPLVLHENGNIEVGNVDIDAVTTGVTPNRQTTQTRQ